MEQNQELDVGLEEEVVAENETTETENEVTETEEAQESDTEQEKQTETEDNFDIDIEYLKSINVDEEVEDVANTTKKDADAFKALRLEKENAIKEVALAKKEKADYEEKFKLLKKELAENLTGMNGDEEEAEKFINNAIEKQSLKLKGVSPEVAKRLQAYEEKLKQYEEKDKLAQAQLEEQQKLYTASNKIESFKKSISSTSNEELGNALKLYEKITGLDVFSNIDTFNKASDYVLKQAVSLYRKQRNPNLVSKPAVTTKKQIPDKTSEDDEGIRAINAYYEELDKKRY